MAGIADISNPDLTSNTTVDTANANIDALTQAGSQLRGIQTSAIKSLFQYDKALSDRYSSPDSKMYIEDAGKRQTAISGYSGAARGEINNVYDLMENVRSAKDDLQKLIDSLTKKTGSGSSSGIAPSDLLSMLEIDSKNEPPPDLYAKYQAEHGILLYKDDPTAGRKWIFAKPYEPVPADYTVWQPTTTKIADVMQQSFGLDRETIAKLAALEAINPALAKTTLNSLISKSFTPASETKLTQQEIEAGVQPGDSTSARNQKMQEYTQSQSNPTYEDTVNNAQTYKDRGYTREQYTTLVAKANDGVIPPDVQKAIDEVYGSEGIGSKIIKGVGSILTK